MTSTGQQVTARVVQPRPSVTTTGTLQADVVSMLTENAEYFEVRFRLKNEDGHLLYQKTEVRHNVTAGDQIIRFSHGLKDLGLSPGRYPIEVRVLATGANATEVASRMLVLDQVPAMVPVAIVVRLTCSPSVDPNGRFLSDPATSQGARTDIGELADIVAADPGLRLSLALSPLTMEEWARASDGYETSGPEGLQTSSKESPGAVASRRALDRVKELLGSGRADLLDTPYAEPDLAGLVSIGGLSDLAGQWALTDSVTRGALGSEVASGAAFLGDQLPTGALPELERRGSTFVVLAPASVRSGTATAGPGVYTLGDSGVRALVYDSRPVRAAAENNADVFYDALFERARSTQPSQPLVLRFEIGPGTRDSIASLGRALGWLSDVPWVDIIATSEAAAYPDPGEAGLVPALESRGAPAGYWTEVADARTKAIAARDAFGSADADARSALSDVYVAESLCWAGPDMSYALADRGRAFAASASRYVNDIFASVTIGARDVTLSNRTGEVPVSVVNGTGKPVVLDLVTSASRVTVESRVKRVSLDAGENVLTIPVDMGSVISDTLSIRLVSAHLTIKEATVQVHASYLDRLATLGMVFLVLLGLLLFIRRRVRGAGAGTMPEEPAEMRE